MSRVTSIRTYALIPLMLLLVGLFTACDDDDDDDSVAPAGSHAALHDLAHDSCESLEGAVADEARRIFDDLVAALTDLGEPEEEARAVLIEECQELVDEFDL